MEKLTKKNKVAIVAFAIGFIAIILLCAVAQCTELNWFCGFGLALWVFFYYQGGVIKDIANNLTDDSDLID